VAVTSPNGWTSDVLSITWLNRIFNPSTRAKANGKPRIIIMNEHHSHLTPEFLEACTQRHIILFYLPAHTTHLTQPLDVSVFSPLKHWFHREVEAYLRNGETRVPKAEFMQIYTQTRPQALTIKNIQLGFKAAGLIPYSLGAVLQKFPTRPLTPPPPCIPLEFVTLKDMGQLQNAIQKRVNPNQDMTVGQVKAALNATSSRRQRLRKAARTRRFQRRQPSSTPEESSHVSEDIEMSEDSDISSCIALDVAI
jgi:hypothetical protein